MRTQQKIKKEYSLDDDIGSMEAGFLMKSISQALKDKGKDDESN
jgi:hypothetical protein